jgi:hypothetical protein
MQDRRYDERYDDYERRDYDSGRMWEPDYEKKY